MARGKNKNAYGSKVPPHLDHTTPFPELLTLKEGAAILRKTPDGLRKWIKRGKLPAIRLGREYRIERHALEAYLQKCPSVASPPEDVVGDHVGMACPLSTRIHAAHVC